jgi:hypothetical protein
LNGIGSGYASYIRCMSSLSPVRQVAQSLPKRMHTQHTLYKAAADLTPLRSSTIPVAHRPCFDATPGIRLCSGLVSLKTSYNPSYSASALPTCIMTQWASSRTGTYHCTSLPMTRMWLITLAQGPFVKQNKLPMGCILLPCPGISNQ